MQRLCSNRGLNFDEYFSPVSRLEAIIMFLVFSIFKKFKINQMDVKCYFLNEELQEEVYIEHLEGFQLTNKPDYVCRLKKALYGLKQAPIAWYSKLDNYLLKCGFKRGAIENNLYAKEKDRKLNVVVVYVDDIIFSSDSNLLTNEFVADMIVQLNKTQRFLLLLVNIFGIKINTLPFCFLHEGIELLHLCVLLCVPLTSMYTLCRCLNPLLFSA